MEKQVTTLGDLFAADAKQLARRRLPAMQWLTLLRPVMHRVASPHNPTPTRFRRRAALPRATAALPLFARGPSEEAVLPDEGRALPAPVRERLRPIVGEGIEHVRVHTDRGADAIARQHAADAVTIDRDVFFRNGMLSPDGPRGFALLAHEATHVLEAMRPGAAWRRATEAGVREEEAVALERERTVREWRPGLLPPLAAAEPQSWRPLPPLAAAPLSRRQSTAPLTPAPTPISRPMKADADRDLSIASASDRGNVDAEAMRKSLLRDLRDQLRVEFERGA
jgi:hypothetical protein